MNRFYVSKDNINGEFVRISVPEDVRHLMKVLRVKKGEELYVSDGEGASYLTVLERTAAGSCLFRIKQRMERRSRDQKKWQLSLAVAIPKNTSFEEIIDKGTQLEVDEFIPMVTERTLVPVDRVQKKMERYRRVLYSAARQSGVLFLPYLRDPVDFSEVLSFSSSCSACLLPNLSNKAETLRSAMDDARPGRILACVGPEGDFTGSEIAEAVSKGFRTIGLGESVLRVDTAAIAIASFVRLYQRTPCFRMGNSTGVSL